MQPLTGNSLVGSLRLDRGVDHALLDGQRGQNLEVFLRQHPVQDVQVFFDVVLGHTLRQDARAVLQRPANQDLQEKNRQQV